MGVYIKDMEMPKNCLECVFYRNTSPTYDYCCISTAIPKGYVPEDCPLVEEKTGKWLYITTKIVHDIEGEKTWGAIYKCNNCGFEPLFIAHHTSQYQFCPNCGARMGE